MERDEPRASLKRTPLLQPLPEKSSLKRIPLNPSLLSPPKQTEAVQPTQTGGEPVARKAQENTIKQYMVFQKPTEKDKLGRPPKAHKEKTQQIGFSLTAEDRRFIKQATVQVIQALNHPVNRTQLLRLLTRVVSGMSMSELRRLLDRSPARELRERILR